jgi:hypothetical protein
LTISSKFSIFSIVFCAWIFSWWILHKAIKSDPSDLFVLFQRIEREMWWISVAMFGQSGISQWMTSLGDLWRDFNRSCWYFCILWFSFDKFERILNHIFFKRFDQFVRVYAIRIDQRRSQWLNERSSIFMKCVRKIYFVKSYTFEMSFFFVIINFCHIDRFKIHVKIDSVISFFIVHWLWNPEINLHICRQSIWNICCTTHVVFLLFCYRIGIFFSWSFVRPSWLFNIFHIWNSMFWRAFLWKQRRQVVFLWFRCPLIHKKTIKKEQSESDCKYWKINGKCKIDSRKNQSFFIVGCLISKCLFFRKSNHDVFFHFCGFYMIKLFCKFFTSFQCTFFCFEMWSWIRNTKFFTVSNWNNVNLISWKEIDLK